MTRPAFAVRTPAPREVWQQLVEADDDVLVTQTPRWLECICATGGYEDASRLYEFDSQRTVLVPLARRRGWPARLIGEDAWPSEWGIGGPLADGEPTLAQARAVFEDLSRLPANRISVRFGPRAAPVWAAAVPGAFQPARNMTYILDLKGGFDTVWQERFKSATRTAVRKGEKAGLEVEVDRTGRLVPTFYELYQLSVTRWAAQQHEPAALARWRRRRIDPLCKFQAVAEVFGDNCAVWLASHGGQPAAAMIVLQHGHHAKYWRAGMDKPLASPARASTLLHRYAIEDACAAGCRCYHLGDSPGGSSVSTFKERLGARGYPSFAYRRERFPMTTVDQRLRGVVKRVIGFQDA
ncbi:GNAT family N-acetyltransferase [Streptomyces sp. AC555_RSS877]|uniref:GNAT family N-acetyltransferase n=1 Tax=Streptomyces sp. AC555_RSS877 TaxID=2823688 RepID=UPI001C252759|nr:GNAT family N-acetyltransferase [Streptomyces sp. AC555_RSS877]